MKPRFKLVAILLIVATLILGSVFGFNVNILHEAPILIESIPTKSHAAHRDYNKNDLTCKNRNQKDCCDT